MDYGESLLISGLSDIINTENIDNAINYKQIENEFLGSTEETHHRAPNRDYYDGLKDIANDLGIEFDPTTVKRTENMRERTPRPYDSSSFSPKPYSSSFSPRNDNNSLFSGASDNDVSFLTPRVNVEPDDTTIRNERTEHLSAGATPFPRAENKFADFDYDSHRNTELGRRTKEEYRKTQIESVVDDIGEVTSFDLDDARREDEKLTMLEEIRSLRMSLEEDTVGGLDSIAIVSNSSSYDDIQNVLRSLRLINDRVRYCSLADEFILWGAQGLGELFNGERTIFNKYKPDLTGWDKQVACKLRRMKHDTSQLVSAVMNEYNIGPGPRILLELIPNMFMYARRKKQEYDQPDIVDEIELDRSVASIRDMDTQTNVDSLRI